ncbi:MAG: hypothetical protein U9N61_10055 [Euryarchaeota archaeon]|nr:hypothetical protein [Euryarchaeota archaeon]
MCSTRQEIIDDNSLLQDALKSLEKTRDQSTNGDRHDSISMLSLLIENTIKNEQVLETLDEQKELCNNLNRKTTTYPSLTYLLLRQPQAGWPMALAIALTVWLISGIGNAEVVQIVEATGITATQTSVRGAVAIAVMALIFVATVALQKANSEKLKGRN